MIVGRFVDQMIEPRYSQRWGGTDYGAEGKILLIYKKKRLLWRKGHQYWSGLYSPWSYAPARLEVQAASGRLRPFGEDVLEGGRLTMARIKDALPKIRRFMELPELKAIHFDLRKTFMVTRVEGKK